ncbi:Purine nucleoside [Mycena kentingensis (nom. inval.)]|nr:Purine nucleoside [Mycena kentingensis (nom. inval.)]
MFVRLPLARARQTPPPPLTALTFSPLVNLTQAYFLIAGVAGMNPKMGTIGGVTSAADAETVGCRFAKFAVQVGLQFEVDAREMPASFTTGYFGQFANGPNELPGIFYGTEVFELNDALRQRAFAVAKTAKLVDNAESVALRAKYASVPAFAAGGVAPKVELCDTATSDTWWSGNRLSEAFENTTRIWTGGKGTYCTTQQEDNASLQVLLRGALAHRVDFARIIVMRSGSDFDRPPPGVDAVASLLGPMPGLDPSLRNLRIAGEKVPVVAGVVVTACGDHPPSHSRLDNPARSKSTAQRLPPIPPPPPPPLPTDPQAPSASASPSSRSLHTACIPVAQQLGLGHTPSSPIVQMYSLGSSSQDFDDSIDSDDYDAYAERMRRYHNEDDDTSQHPRSDEPQNMNNGQQEAEEERAPSIYHDGQGIKYTLTLQPLPVLRNGSRTATKKATLLQKTIYVHEDEDMAEALNTSLIALERADLDFRVVAGQLRAKGFIADITVPYGDVKKEKLEMQARFAEIVQKVLGKPSPTIKLHFDELPTSTNKENERVSEDARPAKKARTKSDDEVAIEEILAQLIAKYKCNDDSCRGVYCLLIGGIHLVLTMVLLREWAALIFANTDAVDIDNPPNDRRFRLPTDGQTDDVDDMQLLSSRRLNRLRGQAQPSIVVNNDFTGLGVALQGIFQGVAQPLPPAAPPAPAAPAPAAPALVPAPPAPARMSFSDFCVAAGIESIHTRLAHLKLAGPHVVGFLTDVELDALLGVGDRAELRYWVTEWKEGRLV